MPATEKYLGILYILMTHFTLYNTEFNVVSIKMKIFLIKLVLACYTTEVQRSFTLLLLKNYYNLSDRISEDSAILKLITNYLLVL